MIITKVLSLCGDCPFVEMESQKNVISVYTDDRPKEEFLQGDVIVSCKHYKSCKRVYEKMEKRMEGLASNGGIFKKDI